MQCTCMLDRVPLKSCIGHRTCVRRRPEAEARSCVISEGLALRVASKNQYVRKHVTVESTIWQIASSCTLGLVCKSVMMSLMARNVSLPRGQHAAAMMARSALGRVPSRRCVGILSNHTLDLSGSKPCVALTVDALSQHQQRRRSPSGTRSLLSMKKRPGRKSRLRRCANRLLFCAPV